MSGGKGCVFDGGERLRTVTAYIEARLRKSEERNTSNYLGSTGEEKGKRGKIRRG